ncbi:MAG: hypothetical protein KF830_03635 [Planctomycetes bacterium]|nr:hypothetical protein [Planctomycetota bacterium]
MTRADPGWGRVAQAARDVFERLDWGALGEVYCDFGGERFWRERRADVVTLGRELGKRLLHRVPRGGASLWVGAGLGELPVLLGEVLLHGRTVVAANLRARECELLNAALRSALPDVALAYVAEDARTAGGAGAFDHVGCISVFTDPETWPVLSDFAYGRVPPVRLDVERFVAERAAARALAAGLFARLRRPGLVTTTAEEVAWFLEPAAAVGAAIDAEAELVPTAVVGDPVGFLAVR